MVVIVGITRFPPRETSGDRELLLSIGSETQSIDSRLILIFSITRMVCSTTGDRSDTIHRQYRSRRLYSDDRDSVV